MSYAEKLKDPRWQKRRLEILERDEWTCQICKHKELTLHVHHKIYSKGNPWDIDSDCLVTLCEDCHETESRDIKGAILKLNNSIKKIFFSEKIEELSWELEDASKRVSREELSDIINRLFCGPDILESFSTHIESENSDERYKSFITIDNNNI